LWAAAFAAVAGFLAVYVTLGRPDNIDRRPLEAEKSAARQDVGKRLPLGPGSNPLSTGEMAAFVFKATPEVLPEIKFQDASGNERSLAQWRGKVVLLNLWATWCVPCRKEMPALDRLQKELGSDRFEVVAVSVDKTGIGGAKKFLDELKVERLAAYADSNVRLTAALKAVGIPTTLLIDAEGREIGRLTGPAAWDSEDAKRLIRAALE
jgi:thiol-disulfide isomerase/thioredoxin